MKKIFGIVIGILIIFCGVIWIKDYYNDRYVASDSFYTQVPLDEVNKDSWILDVNGVKQEEGKEYNLMGYNQNGEERKVYFTKKGKAEDYYAPGTFIKVNVSKTLVVGMEVIEKVNVPEMALNKIKSLGTRI